jgi:hypothetical protein
MAMKGFVKIVLDKSLSKSIYYSPMSKESQLAAKIKALKRGTSFSVDTEAERQTVCKEATRLRRYGVIDFSVVTRAENGKFKVAAI